MAAALTALVLAVALAVLLVVVLAVLGRSIHAEDQAGDLPTRPPTPLAGLARRLLGLHVQRSPPTARPGHDERGNRHLAGCASHQDGGEAA
jgi:hypothetical protein